MSITKRRRSVSADMGEPSSKKQKQEREPSLCQIEFPSLPKLNFILANWKTFYPRLSKKDQEQKGNLRERLVDYIRHADGTGGIRVAHLPNVDFPNSRLNAYGKDKIPGNPDISLLNVPRPIRQTITASAYDDLDVDNSEPTIVYQIFKDVLELPVMRRYTSNKTERDAMLNEMIAAIPPGTDTSEYYSARDMVKRILISLINGGRGGDLFKILKKAVPWLNQFFQETRMIHKYIKDSGKYTDLIAVCKAKKEEQWNLTGTVIHHLYAEQEMCVFLAAVKYLGAEGFIGETWDSETCGWMHMAYMYDGVMVKTDPRLPDHLGPLSDFVFAETGLRLRFSIKEPDEVWEDVEDFVEPDQLPPEATVYKVLDDVAAADILIRFMGPDLKMDEDGIIYARPPGTAIWRVDEKEVQRIMERACSRLNIELVSKEKDIINFRRGESDDKIFSFPHSRTTTGSRKIIAKARSQLDPTPGFKEALNTSNLRKLLFTNGYIDFEKDHVDANGIRRPWAFVRGFDGVESLACVPWAFPEEGETPEISSVKDLLREKVMDRIWGDTDLRKHHAHFTARALAGNPEDKTWAILRGKRNTGKGVFELLAKTSFGTRYVGTFNLECVKHTAKDEGGDEAKKNSWMAKFPYLRIVFSNEGAVKTINSNMIKKVTSGGDDVMIRSNYVNEYNIQIQARIFANLNHFPGFSSDDGMDFLHVFMMNRQFLSPEKKELPQFKDKPNYLVGDNSIKSWIRHTPLVPQAYLFYLLDHYTRDVVPPLPEMEAAKGDILEEDDEDEWFDKMYVITSDPNDFVDAPTIKKIKGATRFDITSLRQLIGLRRDGDPVEFRRDRPLQNRNGPRGIRGLMLTAEGKVAASKIVADK